MTPLRTLLALLLVVSIHHVVSAQNDPFGGPDPFGSSAPAAADTANQQPGDESLLTKQLLDYSRRGLAERATSIASLVRTGRWQEADQLLSGISGMNPDTPTLAAMFREIGPALFLRMKQSDELSDTAQSALDSIGAAARAAAESAERLRQAIDGLDDPSVDTRLASSRMLIGGGNTAVAELAAAAVSPTPSAPRVIILRALLEFDDSGVDALQQLALYGEPAVRDRALQCLAWIDRENHLPEFVTALHAADASESERQTARRVLEAVAAQLPTQGRAIQLLEEDFRRLEGDAKRIDNDAQSTTLWTVAEDGQTVTPTSTAAMLAAYRDVADAGVRLRRVGGLTAALTGAVLSADMSYRVMVDPDWGDPEQINQVRTSYGSASGPEAVSAAIARSVQAGDHAATIGLLRLIDAVNASESDRQTLLSSRGAEPTPLVMAAANTDPQVRYEAAMTAAQLAQGRPYPGSSYVRKTLAEMSALRDEPTAILVETRPEVVIRLETILSNLGYDTRVVRSVRQLQREIDRGGDLRLVLSKIELADLPPVELVDLVRRAPRGRDLPIVFYGPEDPALMWKRWDAPTVLMDMPSSPAALDGVMDRVQRRRRIPPLSVIDRQRYRAAAAPKPAS